MRIAFVSTIIAVTLTLSVQAQQTSKTVTLKVIETSDVHGHFFPWDFMEGRPLRGTLTRANSYITAKTCCSSITAISCRANLVYIGATM